LRGHSHGGSFPSAANVRNFGDLDRKKGYDFSKRLLLAEDDVMTVTLTTAIAQEAEAIMPFIQQSLDHIRNSILERNDHVLNDYLVVDLISNIHSMYNDVNSERYHDDHHSRLVEMIADNEQLRHTNNTILENMIKGLPTALENDNDWEGFVSSCIPGVINEGFQASARVLARTVYRERFLLEQEDKENQQQTLVAVAGVKNDESPDKVIEDLLYLLRKFVFGPMVGVLVWMLKSPLYSYCIYCRLYEDAQMPMCFLATETNIVCRNAPPIPPSRE
jgi:hypothetical protein